MSETQFSGIAMPRCPTCGTTVKLAELAIDANQPMRAVMQPCQHRVEGEQARDFYAGIPWFYKLERPASHDQHDWFTPIVHGKPSKQEQCTRCGTWRTEVSQDTELVPCVPTDTPLG